MGWFARWRPLSRVVGRLGGPARPRVPLGPGALPAYVAMGHWRPAAIELDGRLQLFIAQLSAELSSCGWCIEQGRHRWRKALLPAGWLSHVRTYRTSALFSERDCAALALVEAVAGYTDRNPTAADDALVRARRYFTESELARIARAAAGEHFFDPVSGAVGQDVRADAAPGAAEAGAALLPDDGGPGEGMPWRSIRSGITVRGWL